MNKDIGLIFIGEKNLKQGWPYKGFDSISEAETLRDMIISFSKKLRLAIDYNYFGVLTNKEELGNVKDDLLAMDGFVVTYLTTGRVYDIFREIVSLGKPTIIYAQPFSGHEWRLYSELKDKSRSIIVASDNIQDLINKIKLLDVVLSLKNSRILMFTDRIPDKKYLDEIKNSYVSEIICLDHNVLNKYYHETDEDQARRHADIIIAQALNVIEPTYDEIIKALRIYYALKNALKDYNANAVTIDCLSMIFHKAIPTTPCIAFSLLNDEGIPAACEADLNSLITMILLRYLADKPSFISDPVPDFSNGYLYHAHCTSATRLRGINREQEKYYLRNHAESLSGVAVQTLWPVGSKVTSVKIELRERILLLHTGEVVKNLYVNKGCRTKFATKVSDVRRFVEEFRGGLHRVIIIGDYIEEMKEIGKLMGLKIIEEMKY